MLFRSVTQGLVARFHAAQVGALSTDDAKKVTQWLDLVGGHHLTPVAVEQAPSWVAKAIVGRPGVRLTGAGGLQTGPFDHGAALGVWSVVCTEAEGGPGAWLQQGAWGFVGAAGQLGFPDSKGPSLAVAQSTCYVLGAQLSAGQVQLTLVDQSPQVKTGSASVQAAKAALVLGGKGDPAMVGEVLLYDHALSDTERDSVIDYLRKAWGLVPP